MPALDPELQDALKEILKSCEQEDKELRKSMMREWKKNEEFWHGIQYLFWSETDDTWKSPMNLDVIDDDSDEDLGSFSDKVVDIFRGHGESIISALAAQVPALRYLPDDADDEDDVIAARTRSKVADLVQRHNKAKLVFLRALFFLALHGLVASYRYKDADFKYGSFTGPVYGNEKVKVPQYTCKECDFVSDEEVVTCPQCGSPEIKQSEVTQTIPKLTDIKELPKHRIKIDIFGPLHFKIPYYARNQSECTYFLLYGDLGKDTVKAAYPDQEDDIDAELLENTDRFARTDLTVDLDTMQKHLVTVKKLWLRPAAYFRTKKEQREKLEKEFPDGVKVTIIGRAVFAGAEPEKLDDRWEIGQSGLSTFIHSDAILRPLVEIQEMRNDLVNLIIETIKHGIPFTLADPAVLNFDTHERSEAVPGYIYKAKAARPGEALQNSFYESSRATLSKEVAVFLKQLDQDAQFCIGSFPSIYGGPSEGKSRTFAEYAASRQMALQRLSIIWNFLTDWWTRTIAGAVDMFVDSMVDDEYFTKFENDNYVKVWIRRAELKGKVGGVEPDASETFPVSLAQKKDLIMKLMELNNEFINAALYLPDNARVIQDVLALSEFKLPGEAQRIKQCIEINSLLKSDPEAVLVQVDPLIDDHQVHIATIKSWAADLAGMDAARTNPAGYKNVIMHMQQHEMNLVQKTMQMGETGPGVPPPTVQAGVEG